MNAATRKIGKPRTQAERDNARIGKAVRKHERNESKLVRAFNAWVKSRAALRTLEQRLQKSEIGGTYDVRDLMGKMHGTPGHECDADCMDARRPT